ncbi:MAG: response regulator [Kofleriaceae bacterium]|nr:response regulator [Kofleriaceae bacterium]
MTGTNNAAPPLATVLIVDDELQVRRFLRAALGAAGYAIFEAGTIAEATALATAHNPDVILLDLGLPDGDGIALTRTLRGFCKTPIIVISARGREDDKVDALDAGADDYVTKPFGVRELLARLRVALRHKGEALGDNDAAVMEFDGLHLDMVKREVLVRGEVVHLTPIEFKLLVLLARHAGRVLTHRAIVKQIWGDAHGTQSHHVRVHLAELRKKIESNPGQPTLIITEPGVGYRMQEARGR